MRVVTSTLLISMVVVAVLGVFLLQSINKTRCWPDGPSAATAEARANVADGRRATWPAAAEPTRRRARRTTGRVAAARPRRPGDQRAGPARRVALRRWSSQRRHRRPGPRPRSTSTRARACRPVFRERSAPAPASRRIARYSPLRYLSGDTVPGAGHRQARLPGKQRHLRDLPPVPAQRGGADPQLGPPASSCWSAPAWCCCWPRSPSLVTRQVVTPGAADPPGRRAAGRRPASRSG